MAKWLYFCMILAFVIDSVKYIWHDIMRKHGADIPLFNEVVDKLRQGILIEEKYHGHELKGKFSAFRECYIKSDWFMRGACKK